MAETPGFRLKDKARQADTADSQHGHENKW